MTAEIDFCMPSLGSDMERGTVTEWCVKEGDRVRRGDIVAVVATEKSDIDIEVWNTGVVAEILVEPGREVTVGTPIARLVVETPTAAEADRSVLASAGVEARSERAGAGDRPPAPVENGIGAAVAKPSAAGVGRLGASPLARRLASELGIDLDGLRGTGPGGAVVARDVTPASIVEPESIEAPQPDHHRRAESLEAMRRAISRSMSRSKRDIPHYYLGHDIDLETSLAWLESTNAQRSVQQRVLPAALLLKAVALAAARVPHFNGFLEDERFRAGDGVHLGVAISLRGGGLIAPAIHDADALSLPELMARLRDLVDRTRQGRLRGSEINDATLTVTNLGDRGVDVVHGVIYPPQVALVGFGRIAERPAVVDHRLEVRRNVTASLAADHRATDGAAGARFLLTIDQLLQKPEEL